MDDDEESFGSRSPSSGSGSDTGSYTSEHSRRGGRKGRHVNSESEESYTSRNDSGSGSSSGSDSYSDSNTGHTSRSESGSTYRDGASHSDSGSYSNSGSNSDSNSDSHSSDSSISSSTGSGSSSTSSSDSQDNENEGSDNHNHHTNNKGKGDRGSIASVLLGDGLGVRSNKSSLPKLGAVSSAGSKLKDLRSGLKLGSLGAGLDNQFSDKEVSIAFDTLDVDQNGHIGIADIRAIVEALGEDVTDEEIDKMLELADTDGSRQVDFLEFRRFAYLSIMGLSTLDYAMKPIPMHPQQEKKMKSRSEEEKKKLRRKAKEQTELVQEKIQEMKFTDAIKDKKRNSSGSMLSKAMLNAHTKSFKEDDNKSKTRTKSKADGSSVSTGSRKSKKSKKSIKSNKTTALKKKKKHSKMSKTSVLRKSKTAATAGLEPGTQARGSILQPLGDAASTSSSHLPALPSNMHMNKAPTPIMSPAFQRRKL